MVNGEPLAIDLCCGLGGWTEGLLAEGWRVIGFDIVRPKTFPMGAQLVLQDIATIDATNWRGVVDLIIASPPCTEFSQMWRFAKHRKPEPDKGIELVNHCKRIQAEAGCPMVLENVYGAQVHIGKASRHVGPYYFWGDIPILLPYGNFRKGIWATKKGYWVAGVTGKTYTRNPAARAHIPIEIARAIASQMRPD